MENVTSVLMERQRHTFLPIFVGRRYRAPGIIFVEDLEEYSSSLGKSWMKFVHRVFMMLTNLLEEKVSSSVQYLRLVLLLCQLEGVYLLC